MNTIYERKIPNDRGDYQNLVDAEICGNCKFFSGYHMWAGDGECRRHAPVLLQMASAGAIVVQGDFPHVAGRASCGDFVMEKPVCRA